MNKNRKVHQPHYKVMYKDSLEVNRKLRAELNKLLTAPVENKENKLPSAFSILAKLNVFCADEIKCKLMEGK